MFILYIYKYYVYLFILTYITIPLPPSLSHTLLAPLCKKTKAQHENIKIIYLTLLLTISTHNLSTPPLIALFLSSIPPFFSTNKENVF